MMATQPSAGRLSGQVPRRVLTAVALLALCGLLVALRADLPAAALFAGGNLWRMMPVVLAGLLITAALTASGCIGLLVATFDARELRAIAMVSLVGAVLPVCGISLLPLVTGLLGAGMALAPVMAFWLSSAVTDPSIFAITASTLGLPFAIGKTVAAFGIGLFGGGVTFALVRLGWFAAPVRAMPLLRSLVPESTCSGAAGAEVVWRFWEDRERRTEFVRTAWRMTRLVLAFLGAAFVAEYFLRKYLPAGALTALVGRDSPLAIPIATLVAAPLYLDGIAALPLVRGLMDRGMAEGAAMAFLVSGGIVSAWTALPVLALVRLPVFVAYVVLAVVGAALSGWLYSGALAAIGLPG